MNLLPKHHEEFRQKEYWDNFFQLRGKDAFEWYGEYPDLSSKLKSLCSSKDAKILVIGCGNSKLSSDMYQAGYQNITNIDFSELVIERMKKSNPEMIWEVMDMTRLTYKNESFDLVLDKGALDALMAENTNEIRLDGERMFSEIERVLKSNGSYLCVSMAQKFIASTVLEYMTLKSKSIWKIQITTLFPDISNSNYSPFVFSFTKTNSNKQHHSFQFETTKLPEQQTTSLSIEWCLEHIYDIQCFVMTRQEMKNLQIGRIKRLDLYSDQNDLHNTDTPRFSIAAIDHSLHGSCGNCAVFLVPQGREHEWLFCTEEGLKQLAGECHFSRLIVVALGHDHTYTNIEQVQQELSPKMLELAPASSSSLGKEEEKIPYLTVAEGIGDRTILYKGKSDLSGILFVEEVVDDELPNAKSRRLVFLSNRNVIQSEVRVVLKKSASASKSRRKNKKKIATLDHSYLAFSYHSGIVHGISFLRESSQLKTGLVIGLGGGILPMHLSKVHPNLTMHVVELDSIIGQVATDYFGFQVSPRMQLFIDDGIEYVKKIENRNQYDLLVVDVDSKDASVGMSCPPASFLEKSFLQELKKCLSKNGVLVINVSCRSKQLFFETLEKIKKEFTKGDVYVLQASNEDVNRVVFATQTQTKLKCNQNNDNDEDILELFQQMQLV